MTAALYTLAALSLVLACGVVTLAIYALGRLSAADVATLAARSAAADSRLAATVAMGQRDAVRVELVAANDATLRAQAEIRALESDCGQLRAALAAKSTPAEDLASVGGGA